MTTIRAHFDGRVLVPEGPVDLPTDRLLEIQVRDVADSDCANRTDELPVFHPPPGTPTLRSEDVYAAEDEP